MRRGGKEIILSKDKESNKGSRNEGGNKRQRRTKRGGKERELEKKEKKEGSSVLFIFVLL